ncbi:MAG: regulatory protein RecX [Desulfuromonadaceae bacterium]|nr:regulatory protein RecX [Desulfuromonadaceae bacterium]MDD2847586.1 regulatory protein RecX [Desulfuromonadaceae bacterium]MDD4131169.1 regulatory protein RecX [Desulfuromonadaceae bacterium]
MKSRNTEPLTAERAYQYALRLLTGRDYTAARLKQKLVVREVSGQDCEDVILRLQREGWLDDVRYAGRFAESALASGRYYGVRLRLEMRRRGFDSNVVDEALAPLLAERDEISEVRSAAERRYPGFSYSAASDRDKRRLVGFLQRRGFGFSAIMRALRTEE